VVEKLRLCSGIRGASSARSQFEIPVVAAGGFDHDIVDGIVINDDKPRQLDQQIVALPAASL
jgi:hypothetical protein